MKQNLQHLHSFSVFEDTSRLSLLPAPSSCFLIQTLQWIEHGRTGDSSVALQLKDFEIFYIKKGSGSVMVDLEKYPLIDNMIICLCPGQVLKIEEGCILDGYYISFSQEFLLMTEGQSDSSLMDALDSRKNLPVIYPEGNLQAEIDEIIKMLSKEFESYCMERIQILKGLLKIFVIYLCNNLVLSRQTTLNDRDTEMVRKFMILVKKNFLTKKMVADYANELFVSPNYLNRIVKKISGHTASHHIQQHIILEAKRQAIFSGLSMKEVAYSLGFNDYAHFSKFFKTNSGMNFTCFRNGLLNRA